MSTAPPPAAAGSHVPQLDGVRAIAVGAVVAYHLSDMRAPRGGWIGVDLFFALSGFLITRLVLIESARRGRPSLRRFWIRRWLRLLPALVVALTAFNLVAIWVQPVNYGGVPISIVTVQVWSVSALLYVTNWLDLLAGPSIPRGLGHLWSLAVEEQFYVVWPIVIWWVARRMDAARATRWVLRIAAVGALISWCLAAAAAVVGAERFAYFSTVTRVGGLLSGAVLGAVWVTDPPSPGWSRTVGWRAAGFVAVGGFAVMLFAASVPSIFGLAPGAAVVGVICTALVAFSLDAHGWVRSLLGLPVMLWIGRRSYAIYLWHEMFRSWFDGRPVVLARVAVLVGTLVAAEVSYRCVEQPALRLKSRIGYPPPLVTDGPPPAPG